MTSVRFERLGTGMQRMESGLAVRQTKQRHALSLASPVLSGGTASATVRVDYNRPPGPGLIPGLVVGVFPADQQLDNDANSPDGKRCVLWVGYLRGMIDSHIDGGFAQVLCDGVRSDRVEGIAWTPGDEVKVEAAFEDKHTAHITFSGKSTTWSKTIRGVPECGLRFGVGMWHEGDTATLVESSTTVVRAG